MSRIETGKSLKQYLTNVINEALIKKKRVLLEMPDEDLSAMKKGDVEAEDVIEKLNTIRSGKSFKDQTVQSNMQKYFGSLDKAERVALLAFLKSIAQIVTSEMPNPQIMEPSEPPASVQIKKDKAKQISIPVQVNISSPVKKKEKEPKQPQEDISGPAPISPKTK